MTTSFVLIPLISALIGWFTNFIAVKMLFHPRKKISLGLFSIQGIFPKRQKAIAEKIGNMVANELISFKDIKDKLNTPELSDSLIQEIKLKLDDYFDHKLAEKFPLIGTFLSGGIKETVKKEFLNEFSSFVPDVIEKLGDKIEENLDLKEMVKRKVENFSVEKLETILMSILKKEFRFIEILGALIGFLIGCIQILLVKYSLL